MPRLSPYEERKHQERLREERARQYTVERQEMLDAIRHASDHESLCHAVAEWLESKFA